MIVYGFKLLTLFYIIIKQQRYVCVWIINDYVIQCMFTCVDMKLPMDSYNYYIHLAKLQDLMKFKLTKSHVYLCG